MARRVFFSFKYEDVLRAMIVRNSWVIQGREAAGFVDSAAFERIKKQGDPAIMRWIDDQMNGTSVTVVLVGSLTCTSRWVRHEIDLSKQLRHGLLGVDISQVRDLRGGTSTCCGQLPAGYPFYRWNRDNGHENLGTWIEAAAKAAGR